MPSYDQTQSLSRASRTRLVALLAVSFYAGWWAAPASAAQAAAQDDETIEEILVTGSRIERTTFNAPSPTRVIDRQEIQSAGFQSMDDIIRDLTINTGSNLLGGIADAGPAARGRSQFNLRGLRPEATLVLLNTNRMPLNLGNFVDTNAIPMSAIGRIEIVKESGSAFYGSDAIAGVVNFITRDVEGFEFEVDYQTTTENNQEDFTVAAAVGAHGDRGGINVFLEVFDRTDLFTIERDFFRDFAEDGQTFDVTKRPTFLALGGPLAGGFVTSPNCEASLGTPTDGPAPAALGLPAGTGLGFCGGSDELGPNMAREGPASQVVPEQKRQLVHVNGEYRFPGIADSLGLIGFDVHGEFNWAHTENRTVVDDIPIIFSVAGPGFPEDKDLVIPATVIDPQTGRDVNPFDFPVAPFGDLLHTLFPVERDSNIWRFVGGVTAEFGAFGYDDWSLNVEGVYGRDTRDEIFPSLSITSLDRALEGRGGFDRDRVFDPFAVDPVSASGPEVVDDVLNTSPRTNETRVSVIQAGLSGTLLDLSNLYESGGLVQVALGAEQRQDDLRENDGFASDTGDLVLLGGDLSFPELGIEGGSGGSRVKDFIERDLWAVYGEVSLGLHPTLDFSGAVRHTDYGSDERIGDGGGIGDTTDPHLSVNWRPLGLIEEGWNDMLRLRGTYGTGFRAPSVDKSNPGESGEAGVEDVVNPFENDAGEFVANCSGTNVETLGRFDQNALDGPEESENWTAGFVFERGGLQASVDYQYIEIDDVIGSVSPQDVLTSACQAVDGDIQQLIDDPELAGSLGVVVAGDAGVVRVAQQFVNEARIEQESLDWALLYTVPWDRFGRLSLGTNGSYISSFELTTLQGRTLDVAGNTNEGTIISDVPDLRFNVSANWVMGRHSANATVRFIEGFTDVRFADEPANDVIGESIGDHTEVDVQYSYAFPTESLLGFGEQTELAVGAINLFDNDPPAAPNEPRNFVREIHDARGRLLYLRFTQAF